MSQGHLRAAGNHHVSVAVFDHARSITNVVRAGGTGRDDGDVGSLHSVHDGQVARDHVDDAGRNEERRHFSRAVLEQGLVLTLDERQSADAGTDGQTDARCVGFRHFQPGILDRLSAGGNPEVDELIHTPQVLGREVLGRVEVGDTAGKAHRVFARVEARDRPGPGTTVHDVPPRRLQIVTRGADDAEPRYHYPSSGHLAPLAGQMRHTVVLKSSRPSCPMQSAVPRGFESSVLSGTPIVTQPCVGWRDDRCHAISTNS